MEQIWGLQVKG